MVVIHEFGHFIVAKLFGVRVEIFSVGMGKRLWGFKRGDTDYRLSLLPIGGYVKMAGENLDEQITGAPDEFMSKPKWQRFCVAIAGPVMNIITAIAIPAAIVMINHQTPAYVKQPAVINVVSSGSAAEQAGLQRGDLIVSIDGIEDPNWQDVEDRVLINPDQDIPVVVKRQGEIKTLNLRVAARQIEQEKIGDAGFEPFLGPNTKMIASTVNPNSPAEEAGLKAGDEIKSINGTPVKLNENPATADINEKAFYSLSDAIRSIQNSNGQPVALTVSRSGETLDIKATPNVEPDGKSRIGFAPGVKDIDASNSRLSLPAAIKYSVEWNLRIVRLTAMAIGQIFSGQRKAGDTVTGPIGIFKLSGQAAEQGARSVLELTAFLSLNLGVFNLLPIPVLDGGLIFMLALEALLGLFGMTLTLRVKERMMQVGFVMLMLLMGFVIFNDISKLLPSRSAPQQVEQQQPAANK
jgi:regulator of sigma E protease